MVKKWLNGKWLKNIKNMRPDQISVLGTCKYCARCALNKISKCLP